MLDKLQGAAEGLHAHQEPLLSVVHVHMQAGCQQTGGQLTVMSLQRGDACLQSR